MIAQAMPLLLGRRTRAMVTAGAVLVVALAGLSASGVLGAGNTRPEALVAQMTNPTYVACEKSGTPICNPSAWQTMVASNPVAQPPSTHPRYVSRDQAIALARQIPNNGLSQAAPLTSEIRARMMTMRQYEKIENDGHDYVTNPHRMLWVVTVHAPLKVQAGFTVKTYDVYTLVVDAETGSSFHVCTCEIVR